MKQRSFTAVAVASIALVAATRAFAYVDFRTPGKATYCYLGTGEVSYSPNPPLVCYTPNDGFTVRMRPNGRVTKRYVPGNKWSYDSALRTLRYSQSWWAADTGDDIPSGVGTPREVGRVIYRCWSRTSGLTCKNRAGHGWWLGRYRGYRVF